jgi:predicted negative regulator of RcsB-dependent stress response
MMVLWWSLVRAWWKPALAVIAVLSVVWYIDHNATQNERLKQRQKEAQAYERTIEAVSDSIDTVRGLTLDDTREWLREYAK